MIWNWIALARAFVYWMNNISVPLKFFRPTSNPLRVWKEKTFWTFQRKWYGYTIIWNSIAKAWAFFHWMNNLFSLNPRPLSTNVHNSMEVVLRQGGGPFCTFARQHIDICDHFEAARITTDVLNSRATENWHLRKVPCSRAVYNGCFWTPVWQKIDIHEKFRVRVQYNGCFCPVRQKIDISERSVRWKFWKCRRGTPDQAARSSWNVLHGNSREYWILGPFFVV